MTYLNRTFVVFLAALALLAIPGSAQMNTLSSTTLGAAVADVATHTISLASVTSVNAPGNPLSTSEIGTPAGTASFTMLFVDKEAMQVLSVNTTAKTAYVARGYQGTTASTHANGATVWLGPPQLFANFDPTGSCTATSLKVLPYVAIRTGNVFTCPASGPSNGLWVRQATAYSETFQFTDNEFVIAPGDCISSVSDHAGTLGLLATGASNVPAIQAATTTSATTNTLTYTCIIRPPFRTSSGKGVALTSATAAYGVQTTALGTQAATLASGTYNGSIVFSTVTLPAAGASETPSTVTPVRADSGTMAITPSAVGANTATTTAGGFVTQTFTPAAPITLSDSKPLLFTFTLQGAASPGTATVTNLFAVTVKYVNVPL